jgi:hypothetical protein
MKNGFKAAALSFGVAILFGSVGIGYADSESIDKSSESHRSETTTVVPAALAVVMVQPASVAVVPAPEVVVAPAPAIDEHSSSHSSSRESSPSGNSASEKTVSSHTSNY